MDKSSQPRLYQPNLDHKRMHEVMEEIKQTPYELDGIKVYEPVKFHMDTEPIDALVQAK